MSNYTHGELADWLAMIRSLPDLTVTERDLLTEVAVRGQTLGAEDRDILIDKLMELHPWRKGPFNIHGLLIDTEWRSDWKWERIAPFLENMQDSLILDVGCGNGYHLFRMAGTGAKLVLGIDPSQKFYAQYLAMNHFIQCSQTFHLPIGIEHMTAIKAFDKVFSMGVLYHRKSPIDHILQLKSLTRPGGEIILETLVVEGDVNQVLIPTDRYAQMRNVWFLPSTDALRRWLERCDLMDIRLLDVTQTSLEEQRRTDWMTFHSLENYLDPENHKLTIEGYQAPTRATFAARVMS